MGWKEFTYHLVSEFCNTMGLRTFTLQEFFQKYEMEFAAFAPRNQHLYAKVRQQVQILRDGGLLTFVDNHGTYTLRGVDLLRDEVDEPELIAPLPIAAREWEYLVEIRARDRGWVRLARHTFGDYCLVPKCVNTFLKDDGTRYVEVHHIEPLSEGGEEQIWNLAVICAHHHRVAHYARETERGGLRGILLETTQRVLVRR